MKVFILAFITLLFSDDINEIAAVNRLKKEAEIAYKNEDYGKAAATYSALVDSLNIKDDRLLLNLSNSYFKLNDTTNAKYNYNLLTDSDNKSLKSIAYQQLGVLANNTGKYEIALEQFKNSLRANPENEESRYNYELLKKLMENQQQQNQDQQNKDQQQDQNKDQEQDNKDQQKQDQKDKEQNEENQQNKDQENQQQEEKEQNEEQKSQEEQKESDKKNENQPDPQKMEEMKISEEMAKMILEAMKNNEVQYIQQQKKKPTKPRESGKPDW